jgi:DNA-binding SARP family transcriptional activator
MSVATVARHTEDGLVEARLEVKLLGGFEIHSAGQVHVFDKRKACAILAYLLLSGQYRETRGRLSALLWSDRDEEHARASLRQSIRDLRQIEVQTGVNFLAVDKLSVGIDRTLFKTDIATVHLALKQRDFAIADGILAQRSDSLCAGLQDCDPVFDNWLRMTATHWSDSLVQQLSKALDAPNSTVAERKAIASCILHVDPLHEAAAMEMLRALYREGGFASAHGFFERYSNDLRAELDIAPPRDMIRQLEEFKTGERSDVAGAAPQGRIEPDMLPNVVEKPTIVLVTEKYRASDAHIQFALVSELSASLSRFRHWTAIQAELDPEIIRSRSIDGLLSALKDIADVAVVINTAERGTERLFEISCVSLTHGELHFTTTAPHAPSGWRTVFNEICAQVASRLQLAISSTRLHRIDTLSPNYISAYDHWLDGQRLSILWRNDTEAAAIARYEDAIRLDPKLACAYSSLAAILNSRWIVLPGYPLDSADLERAFDLAKQAVMLDPLDHRNQVNLAWSHLLARRWELADFHFGLAHDLNAANPATLIAYALASAFVGSPERAVDLARRSFELNPLHDPHYYGYLATISFLAGDLPGCIQAVEKSDGLFPDIRGWSAAAHALSGNDAAAGADFRVFLRSISAAWYNNERPSRRAAIDWFKNVFPIRIEADRERLAQGIDRAARLA